MNIENIFDTARSYTFFKSSAFLSLGACSYRYLLMLVNSWKACSSIVSCKVIHVSVNSNWVHTPPPRATHGISSKKLPGGRELTFQSCPGAENSIRAGILWKCETFCPCISFIGDKYRVSQELLKKWGTVHC